MRNWCPLVVFLTASAFVGCAEFASTVTDVTRVEHNGYLYILDWRAISAIASSFAAIAALWIAHRSGRRTVQLERSRQELTVMKESLDILDEIEASVSWFQQEWAGLEPGSRMLFQSVHGIEVIDHGKDRREKRAAMQFDVNRELRHLYSRLDTNAGVLGAMSTSRPHLREVSQAMQAASEAAGTLIEFVNNPPPAPKKPEEQAQKVWLSKTVRRLISEQAGNLEGLKLINAARAALRNAIGHSLPS